MPDKDMRAIRITHGHAGRAGQSRTYQAWANMKARCLRPSHISYPYYGGRGIGFDPSWNEFKQFLADMGEVPAGMTLERIDNYGHYSRGNCRWASQAEQKLNYSRNIRVEYDGRNLTLTEWSRYRGINKHTIRSRLIRGWDAASALGYV